jgi:hypothetical protein
LGVVAWSVTGAQVSAQNNTLSITQVRQSMIRSDIRATAPAAVPATVALLHGDVKFTNFAIDPTNLSLCPGLPQIACVVGNLGLKRGVGHHIVDLQPLFFEQTQQLAYQHTALGHLHRQRIDL